MLSRNIEGQIHIMTRQNEKNEPEVTIHLAKEHGLSEWEYNRVTELLGREPNYTELGCFSVMWSEHCSYKNSIDLLKTLPRKGDRLLVEAGEENAGLVDIGDGQAIAFKIESHNHPSAIEPYQGAATGVGGILRDIFTMGARPIAALNSLRFGDINNPRVRYLFRNVVKGIGDYGNCFGVPTVGGEVYFDKCYTDNPLVNAMAVGVVRHSRIASAVAKGVGNPVMIVGSATGRDGIHGATFASEDLSKESEAKRPSVQVGDPFTEKLLLEATLEVIKANYLIGIQDMGAAGVICSTSEMSFRGESGMDINLDLIPTREENMTAYEILLSESQERMLMVVKKGYEQRVQDIFEKWDLHAVVIGTVTDDGYLHFWKDNDLKASIPARSLVLGGDAPVYKREVKKPDYIEAIRNEDLQVQEPSNYNSVLLQLLSSPNISGKRWVYEQYDSMVQTNTIIGPGSDAAIIRVKKTEKAIAVSTDCNGRYVYLNPRRGAQIAVAEAARNIVCSGATPVAVTNCLNFGNPYDPEIYYQFSESVAGMRDACTVFNTPVTGGNVSFYNESPTEQVYPTPVIGMLGILDDLSAVIQSGFRNDGDRIILLGNTRGHLGGTEYLARIHGKIIGDAPDIDLEEEKKLHEFLLNAIAKDLVKSAHDISDGGLAVAIAESCITGNSTPIGARIIINSDSRIDKILFGEDQSRIILSIERDNISELKELHKYFSSITVTEIGIVGGKRLIINDIVDLDIDEIGKAYHESLHHLMNRAENIQVAVAEP
jgi:phosphoribosylformylglycinamidine synthase subunit PurL